MNGSEIGRQKKEEASFLKKRSKKRLPYGARRQWIGAPLIDKVFLLLFVHKKKTSSLYHYFWRAGSNTAPVRNSSSAGSKARNSGVK